MQIHKKILIATPLYPPSTGGPATFAQFAETHVAAFGGRVTVRSFEPFLAGPYIIRHLRFLRILFKDAHGVDTVLALDPLGVGMPALIAARLHGKRFVVRIAGDRAWETGQDRYGVRESLELFARRRLVAVPLIILKWLQWTVANLADAIIVPSEYMRSVVASWGIPEERISVVYSSIERATIAESRDALRARYKMHTPTIFSAGRLVPWKGFAVLIELVPALIEKFPNVHLYIAGDGPQKEQLRVIIKDKKLSEYVTLFGRLSRDDVARYAKASDVFVLNTGYEGFSHQLLEVMDQGTPIVATRVGGNPELIMDGENGLLVGYNDAAALTAALAKILGDAALARALGDRGRASLDRFTSENSLTALIPLL